MNDVKQNEVATLYALRGGLSVVSRERDRIDGILTEAKNKRNGLINPVATQISTEEAELDCQKRRLQNRQPALADIKNTIAEEEATRKKLMLLRVLCWGLVLLTAPIALLGWWIVWVIFDGGDPDRAMKKCKEKISVIKECKKRLPILENEIAEAERRILLSESKLSEFKNTMTAAWREGDMIAENARRSVVPSLKFLREYINNLETMYGGMLDMRDWKNLDLVIFAIETRRADNIKEALVYVDGEVRTGRIEKAIFSASREISISIDNGLHQLRESMTQSFMALSDNFTRAMSEVADSQSAKMNELIGVQQLNNALLEKSATSSAKLAADVNALRQNSDYANWRLRSIS